jgi:hypothetical protein
VLLWAGTWIGLGYAFSGAIALVAERAARLGRALGLVVAAALAAYVAVKYVRHRLFLRALRIARISPELLKRRLDAGEDITIIDLRTPLEVAVTPFAIPGSSWLTTDAIDEHESKVLGARDLVLASPPGWPSASLWRRSRPQRRWPLHDARCSIAPRAFPRGLPWARAEAGEAPGITQTREGVLATNTTGTNLVLEPLYRLVLADACMKFGQTDEGLLVTTRRSPRCRRGKGIWQSSEFHRLKGELLLLRGPPITSPLKALFARRPHRPKAPLRRSSPRLTRRV